MSDMMISRTSKYQTISTTYFRMPFGLASVPEVYQQITCGLLKGIDNVVECMTDNVLIHKNTNKTI